MAVVVALSRPCSAPGGPPALAVAVTNARLTDLRRASTSTLATKRPVQCVVTAEPQSTESLPARSGTLLGLREEGGNDLLIAYWRHFLGKRRTYNRTRMRVIAASPSTGQKVPRHRFGHFQSSEQRKAVKTKMRIPPYALSQLLLELLVLVCGVFCFS